MEFAPDQTQRQRFDRIMARPLPVHEYCIYFTPRSGSSWLTDLASRSGFLGGARENFNPNAMAERAQHFGARDLDEYIEVIRRRFMGRGTFGFEITFFQLLKVFGSAEKFMSTFAHVVPFWLIREDIVGQAVSLWKMEATGIGHSTASTPKARAAADEKLCYDAEGIARWLAHLVSLERLTEAHFATFGMTPFRMSYERMMAAGPEATRAFMAQRLERRHFPPRNGDPTHTRIATDLNRDFSDRFRHEQAMTCAEVFAAREGTLCALHDFDGGGDL